MQARSAIAGLAAIVALSACGNSEKRELEPTPGVSDDGNGATAAPVFDATPSAEEESDPMATLDRRVDLDLTPNEPTAIEPLGVTATLLSADRVRVEHKGGIGHQDRLVIRFEKPGESPQEVTFGESGRVHTLYGHEMAVFGGTVLSVFPPGQPAMP